MKNFKITFLFVWVCISFASLQAQKIERVEPTHWYVGFKQKSLQLLVYGKDISTLKPSLRPYKGVTLKKVNLTENPNYLFLDLEIGAGTLAGNLIFDFKEANKSLNLKYALKNRSDYKTPGVNSTDFIYLLMPDRFSDGDPKNNAFKDMADTDSDRKNPWLRHGGDLKGIENHLDYFTELGVTALWLNPVSENNQPQTDEGGQKRSAYHGYGITDFYNVDKRFGGNAAYLSLIDKAHKKGLKIIQDAIYNHVGINHWILKDIPAKNWLNQWDSYTNTSYKDQPLFDPNASQFDKKQAVNGWFVPFLPDLNHKNPFVANYLIQQALWNTEMFSLDAWRIDTYFYNDLEFMNRCNAAILSNYPAIHIFGESWVNSVANQALLTENNFNYPFKSNLPGNVDFMWCFSALAALNEKPGWNDGIQKKYQVLAQDYMYKHPEKMVLFLDNHDLDRFYSVVGEDYEKFKTGMIWLLTTRGIPQMYYGTEILMKNFKNPSDAEVRKDFPGGFEGDTENKFKAEGRSPKENETFDFVKKIANFRKTSAALSKGRLLQYLPFDNGVYGYFRIDSSQTVFVISNTSEESKTIDLARFSEGFGTKTTLRSVVNTYAQKTTDKLTLGPKASQIFVLTP